MRRLLARSLSSQVAPSSHVVVTVEYRVYHRLPLDGAVALGDQRHSAGPRGGGLF